MVQIIEFYGAPGSGKTTLSEFTASHLSKNYRDTRLFDEAQYIGLENWSKFSMDERRNSENFTDLFLKYFPIDIRIKFHKFFKSMTEMRKYREEMTARFSIENSEMVKCVIDDIKESYESPLDAALLNWFMSDFYRYGCIENSIDDHTVVLEDGMLKRIATLYSLLSEQRSPDDYEENMKELVDMISSHIDMAFFIHTEANTAYERQKDRGFFCPEHKLTGEPTKTTVLRELERYNENFKLISASLENKDVPIFKIDNDKSLSSAKKQIKNVCDDRFEKH